MQDPELILLKQKRVELLRKKLSLQKRFGLNFYQPHAKQSAFHAAGVKFRRRMVRAGNRFGKSECGCAEDCAWLKGERSWLPEGNPARKGGIPQHPVKLLTITTDWDKVDEIWTSQRGSMGKVWRFLPKDGFIKTTRRNHSGAIDTIECSNGSIWRFDTVKSFMANPLGSESSDWDAIHVDEPCPQAMWTAASRGLMDRRGSAWFTLTPLSEPWISDYFFPTDTGGAARDDVWAVNGSIYDNPYISKEGIDEYVRTLNHEERECRVNGLPLHMAGLVYKQFQWQKHVLTELPKGWQSWTKPPVDWTYYIAIDPHPQTPHAVLFSVVDPCDRRFYYHDIFNHCRISSLCQDIHKILDGRKVNSVRIDPSAYVNDPVTERNMAMEFWRCGVRVQKATKALSEGILKVQSVLGSDPQCVYFTPSASRTLWEIQRYSWDPKRPDSPIDKDDHTMECLYRIESQNPHYTAFSENLITTIDDIEIVDSGIGDDELDINFDEELESVI